MTMNRYLSCFEALCNWYTSYKQSRKPRVQETASGDTPDPVVQKKNELFCFGYISDTFMEYSVLRWGGIKTPLTGKAILELGYHSMLDFS